MADPHLQLKLLLLGLLMTRLAMSQTRPVFCYRPTTLEPTTSVLTTSNIVTTTEEITTTPKPTTTLPPTTEPTTLPTTTTITMEPTTTVVPTTSELAPTVAETTASLPITTTVTDEVTSSKSELTTTDVKTSSVPSTTEPITSTAPVVTETESTEKATTTTQTEDPTTELQTTSEGQTTTPGKTTVVTTPVPTTTINTDPVTTLKATTSGDTEPTTAKSDATTTPAKTTETTKDQKTSTKTKPETTVAITGKTQEGTTTPKETTLTKADTISAKQDSTTVVSPTNVRSTLFTMGITKIMPDRTTKKTTQATTVTTGNTTLSTKPQTTVTQTTNTTTVAQTKPITTPVVTHTVSTANQNTSSGATPTSFTTGRTSDATTKKATTQEFKEQTSVQNQGTTVLTTKNETVSKTTEKEDEKISTIDNNDRKTTVEMKSTKSSVDAGRSTVKTTKSIEQDLTTFDGAKATTDANKGLTTEKTVKTTLTLEDIIIPSTGYPMKSTIDSHDKPTTKATDITDISKSSKYTGTTKLPGVTDSSPTKHDVQTTKESNSDSTDKSKLTTEAYETTHLAITTVKQIEPQSTLSPNETEYFNKIEEKITKIVGDKNKPLSNANNTSEYLKNMTPNEIVTMATKVASGTFDEILGNLTKEEFFKNLKQNLDNKNTELAEAMNKIIKELSETKIDSPASLGAVLGSLQNALKNSMTVSIGGNKKNSGSDGNFNVTYGTIRAQGFDAVACRSTVTLKGNDGYVKGDIRSALIQESGQNIITSEVIDKKLWIKFAGLFARSSGVQIDNMTLYDKNKLYDDQLRLTPEIEPKLTLFDSASSLLSLHSQIWNITLDPYRTKEQSQMNSSATAYLPVEELTLNFKQVTDTLLQDLQAGKIVQLTKARIKVKTLEDSYDILSFRSAKLSMSEFVSNIGVLTIDNADMWDVEENMMSKQLKNIISFPIVIENVNCSLIGKTASTQLQLEAAWDSVGMTMPVMLQENLLPAVDKVSGEVVDSVLSITSTTNAAEALKSFEDLGEELVVNGKIQTEQTTYTLTNAKLVNTGKTIKIRKTDGTTIELLNPKYLFEQKYTDQAVIRLTAGNIANEVIPHYKTVIEIGAGTTIFLTGGYIKRNGTDGYSITGAKISSIGPMPSNSIDLDPQSLMNQDSQNMIIGILNDNAAYLRNNATSFTDEEMENTAKHLMDITDRLIDSIMTSLNNPLSSDMALNLAKEKANYDDLFTVLPSDPSKIRYIEEYTEEEWALEATKLVQEELARNMAKQIADTMDALLDGFAARAIAKGEIPFLITMSSSGQTIVAAGGNSSFMLNQTYQCNDWTTTFPPSLVDMNVFVIKDSDNYRLNIFCFTKNPYAYTWGYKLLISSGTVDLTMKQWNGERILVENTTKPITIRGAGTADTAASALLYPSDFLDYQILDLTTFRTVSWNNSIMLEFEMGGPVSTVDITGTITSENEIVPQLWVFVSYQQLPGPMPGQHHSRFKVKKNGPNRFFIPMTSLYNSTGLFFVGVGQLADPGTPENKTLKVEYPITGEEGVEWTFMRGLTVSYEIRVLTKGCYYYNGERDMFESVGVLVADSSGDKYVKCNANHLTSFSVGLFTALPNTEFDYVYLEDVIPRDQSIITMNIYGFLLMLIICLFAFWNDNIDIEKGRLRVLLDNKEQDQYSYIIAIETGIRVFATTESEILFNLYGTKGQELRRSLHSIQDKYWGSVRLWGTTSRYLLTSQWPLGDITGMHLWITGKDALQYRESWHIQKIAVKDIQTEKIYYFKVDKWMGNAAKTGKTTLKVQDPTKEISLFALWPQILGRLQIIAAFTGGDGVDRLRVTRVTNFVAIGLALVFTNFFQVLIVDLEFLSDLPVIIDFVVIQMTWTDIICGVFGAILMFLLTNFVVLLSSNTWSESENDLHEIYKRKQEGFAPGWAVKRWTTFLILLISQSLVGISFTNVLLKYGRLTNDHAVMFLRRWFLMMAIWLVPIEIIKAFAIIIWKKQKDPGFWIIRKEETALLAIHKQEEFKDPPAILKNEGWGDYYINLVKKANIYNRMRDEDLWNTLFEFILFFASMIIMLGVVCFSQDNTNALLYNQNLRATFKLDPQLRWYNKTTDRNSFLEIRQVDHFWRWAQNDLVGGLRVHWYDGNPAFGMRGYINDKMSRAMGIGTIRQIRSEIKYGEPIMKAGIETKTHIAFGEAKETKVFTQVINGVQVNLTKENGTEYEYRTAEDMKNGKVNGVLRTYPGGGFAVSMEGTLNELNRTFQKLQANRWIDEWTRAVVIEFSTYNPGINHFGVFELIVEFPVTNVVTSKVWIEPVKLIKYTGNGNYWLEKFEMAYLIYCATIFALEFILFWVGRWPAMKEFRKREYKKGVCTLIRGSGLYRNICFAVSIAALISIFIYDSRAKIIQEVNKEFTEHNGNSYINLSRARNAELLFRNIFSCVFFWAIVKSVRILKFNRRISYFTDTLESCASDVFGFSLGFFTSFGTFTATMHFILWNTLESYNSWSASIQSNISALFGKNTESQIYEVSTLCDIIFQLFMWTNNFMMINIFIMIVMGHFDMIRRDPSKQSNDYEMIDHIRGKVLRFLNLWEWSDAPPLDCPNMRTDGTIATGKKLVATCMEIVDFCEHRDAAPNGIVDRPAGFRPLSVPAQHYKMYPLNQPGVKHKLSRIEDIEDREAIRYLNDYSHQLSLGHEVETEEGLLDELK